MAGFDWWCRSFGIVLGVASCAAATDVLVFSRTTGFRHGSIGPGITAINSIGSRYGLTITATEDPTAFTSANLANYEAVVFLQTTENSTTPLLNTSQRTEFENYIRAGGGFVGVHAATDVTNSWPWYVSLIGARFLNHPSQQQATIDVVRDSHVSTAHLDSTWSRFDEWYNFQQVSPNLTVLLELDESTYNGGSMGANHPIAWLQEFDGGRSWYTGMGHTNNSYSEPAFVDHLAGGILWSAGLSGDYSPNGAADAADYTSWRDGLGTTFTQPDYAVWKTFFGTTTLGGEASSASVPEPMAWLMILVSGMMMGANRRSSQVGWH